MNRIDFITKLDNYLKGVTYDDKKEIIYDYEEHFTIGIEQGKTEEEISNALGDPKLIAKQFKNDYFISKAENNKSAGNLVNAVFASMGIGFMNLFILPLLFAAACVVFALLLSAGSVVFSIVLVLASVLFSLYAAAVAMAIGGIALILAIFLAPVLPEYISIDINTGSAVLLSIGVFCLGILAFLGARKVTHSFYNCSRNIVVSSYNIGKRCVSGFYMWVLKYLKFNVSIITRKKENEDA